MNMKTRLQLYGLFFFMVFLLFIVYKWQSFKYHECKKVGHSTLYCVMDIGK
jgi:hypothetical protein